MKKRRRRNALPGLLGEEPPGISPAEELREAADLLSQQEPPVPPRCPDPEEIHPLRIDPADGSGRHENPGP